jgi:hypothetical protein
MEPRAFQVLSDFSTMVPHPGPEAGPSAGTLKHYAILSLSYDDT